MAVCRVIAFHALGWPTTNNRHNTLSLRLEDLEGEFQFPIRNGWKVIVARRLESKTSLWVERRIIKIPGITIQNPNTIMRRFLVIVARQKIWRIFMILLCYCYDIPLVTCVYSAISEESRLCIKSCEHSSIMSSNIVAAQNCAHEPLLWYSSGALQSFSS